jgi:hypothetical protein
MEHCSLCLAEVEASESTVVICPECEIRFAEDEAFATKFFREHRFDTSEAPVRGHFGERVLVYASFDPASFEGLRRFVLGTLVRFELGWRREEKSIFGPLTEELFAAYLDPGLGGASFPILIDQMGADAGADEKIADEIFSGRIWKLKTQSFFYLGYRVLVFSDGRHTFPEHLEELILRPGRVRALLPEEG